MSDLPTGTVTFLFTDIEGSTKLWQQFPDAMPDALARHHEILQRAIAAHNGYVFQIIGDAFCAAFATAFDGLDAALAAQRALRDFAWGETGAIRVRMALHTGAAEVRAGEFTSGEYVSGITLSRAARLLSAGHGGQILLSASTTELVRERMPHNTALRDMGARRLKDLVQPQQIFQILTSDLPQDFSPLKTLDALPNNLPVQLTSFVGREREIQDIKRLLTNDERRTTNKESDVRPSSSVVRLLTLIGAGGSGKTRLSLQVAADVIDEFEKGAWFVELAPIADASLVPNAVMSALELREEAGRAPLDALTDFLRAKKLLLILDNCEHLVEACAHLAHDLLTHCPNLKILATSREALGVAGEVTYQVPVMGLPDPKHLPTLEALSQYDAVKLFIERAISIQPNFSVTNTNAPAVAQICFRLDGIPLAIELAAARIKIFSPEQIAARLDDRFRLLTGGSRTATPRQQTLRAAIEWSYGLLSEQERVLFRRLAVFVGGCTFEGAEQVCAGDGLDAFDILELLAHLVDKSLVTTELRGDETRYRMLETIREYAFEKLKEVNEEAYFREHHMRYFLNLAETSEPKIRSSDQMKWLSLLGNEHPNLRAAIEWSLLNNAEHGIRLVASLPQYWIMSGLSMEGHHYLAALLSKSDAHVLPSTRASGLIELGQLMSRAYALQGEIKSTYNQALALANELNDERLVAHAMNFLAENLELREAIPLFNQSAAIYRRLNDHWHLAEILRKLAVRYAIDNDSTKANQFLREGLELSLATGDNWLIGRTYEAFGHVAMFQHDYDTAVVYIEQSLEMSKAMKDRDAEPRYSNQLGELARLQGDYSKAKLYYEAAQEGMERNTGRKTPAFTLNQGFVALYEQDLDLATALFKQSLQWYSQRGRAKNGVALSLTGLAGVAIIQQSYGHAARLLGASTKIRDDTLGLWDLVDQVEHDRILKKVESQKVFSEAYHEGYALTMEQAIELALSET